MYNFVVAVAVVVECCCCCGWCSCLFFLCTYFIYNNLSATSTQKQTIININSSYETEETLFWFLTDISLDVQRSAFPFGIYKKKEIYVNNMKIISKLLLSI